MLSNLPPGVTQQQIDDLYLDDVQLERICDAADITLEDFDQLDVGEQEEIVRKFDPRTSY